MSIMTKKNNTEYAYFVLKGRVGRYSKYENAIKETTDKDPSNVLKLPVKFFRQNLKNELFKLIQIKTDLDIDSYVKYIGENTVNALKSIQRSNGYTTAYIGRRVDKNYHSYVILISSANKLYYYKNKNTGLKYGSNSDIVPVIFLKKLEDKYNIVGNVISYIPLEKEMAKYLPNWKYIKYIPTEYDMMMGEVNNILMGKETIMNISEIEGGL